MIRKWDVVVCTNRSILDSSDVNKKLFIVESIQRTGQIDILFVALWWYSSWPYNATFFRKEETKYRHWDKVFIRKDIKDVWYDFAPEMGSFAWKTVTIDRIHNVRWWERCGYSIKEDLWRFSRDEYYHIWWYSEDLDDMF